MPSTLVARKLEMRAGAVNDHGGSSRSCVPALPANAAPGPAVAGLPEPTQVTVSLDGNSPSPYPTGFCALNVSSHLHLS
jgi:hypothetical protein